MIDDREAVARSNERLDALKSSLVLGAPDDMFTARYLIGQRREYGGEIRQTW